MAITMTESRLLRFRCYDAVGLTIQQIAEAERVTKTRAEVLYAQFLLDSKESDEPPPKRRATALEKHRLTIRRLHRQIDLLSKDVERLLTRIARMKGDEERAAFRSLVVGQILKERDDLQSEVRRLQQLNQQDALAAISHLEGKSNGRHLSS